MTYLPSTEFVRGVYAANEMATVPEHAGQDLRVRAWGRGVAEFQRWLDDHDAKIRAEIIGESASTNKDFEAVVAWADSETKRANAAEKAVTEAFVPEQKIRADERAKIAAAIRESKSPHYSAKYRAGIECGARIAERAS